jgi:PHP family Zn ribbon phosphoesterase
VLTSAAAADLKQVAGERLAQAVLKARLGDVRIDPGYDGIYGKVQVWPDQPTRSPNSNLTLRKGERTSSFPFG